MPRTRRTALVGARAVVWIAAAGWQLAAVPHALPAQSTTAAVIPERALTFGALVPGAAEIVTPQDAWRRATLRLEGSGAQTVRFLLPAALVAASGATIPLQFGAAAGAYETAKGKLHPFDPSKGTKITLNAGQDVAWIHLGGTAVPAKLQRAGSYSATVTVVVAPPNM